MSENKTIEELRKSFEPIDESIGKSATEKNCEKRKIILEFLGITVEDDALTEIDGISLNNVRIDERDGSIYKDKEKISIIKVHAGDPQRKLGKESVYVLILGDKANNKFYYAKRETHNKFYKKTDNAEHKEGNKKSIWKDEKNIYDDNKIEELKTEIKGALGVVTKSDNEKNTKEQIEEWIENGANQIILTGAPGTGKTRLAKEIATEMGKKYELVQFHPSYDYTDFIEGLRPVTVGDDKNNEKIEFRKLDGTFKKFCRTVAEENEKDANNCSEKYFFIIDEINRSDLSKVFGELMYCLESDKRGKKNKIPTQYQNLTTYFIDKPDKEDIFKEGFYIPENVIIIGTMNDIDRSVESMDFALRRRFLWYEVEVTRGLLLESLKSILNLMDKEEVINKIIERVDNLNGVIKDKPGLGKHFFISQGQFANLPQSILNSLTDDNSDDIEKKVNNFMEKVFELRLRSLLYEYVRGEGNEATFLKECKKALKLIKESNTQADTEEKDVQ